MAFLFLIIISTLVLSFIVMMRHVKGEVDFFSLEWDKGFYALIFERSRFDAKGNFYRWLFIGSFVSSFIAAQFLD